MSGLTTLGGSELLFDLDDAGNYDKLKVTGDLVLAEDTVINLSFLSENPYFDGTYKLIEANNLEGVNFQKFLAPDLQYAFNLTGTAEGLILSVDRAAVPEPAAWGLMLLGVCGLFCRRWTH